MHIRVEPSNRSSFSNEENINVEDVPDAITYVCIFGKSTNTDI